VSPTEAALVEKRPKLVNKEDPKWQACFDDQAKTVVPWLGSSNSSAVFTRHCTFEFPFILVFTKFS